MAAEWPLAAFQTGGIKDTLYKAAMVYSDIPAEDVLAVERPLADMDRAIKTRDKAGFDAAHGSLARACNGCHRAANVGFIVIETPNARQGSDQKL